MNADPSELLEIKDRRNEIADGLEAMAETPGFAQGHAAIMRTAASALRSPQPSGVRVAEDIIAQTLWNEHLFYADALVFGDKMIVPDMAMAERLAALVVRALEPQQEEAVAPNKQSLETALALVDDVIVGPEPDEALEHLHDLLKAMLLSAHPTPAQKVQESQTVSEEMRLMLDEVLGHLADAKGNTGDPDARSAIGKARDLITAALEQIP